MRVQVLQHVPFEGLGSMEAWLTRQGADMQYTKFYQSAMLPDPGSIDLVIAMGGPMSVNDEREYPWLREEKRFIKQAIHNKVPVVGVCLGAQIIASALGAKVFACPYKEIGWFPIEAVDADPDAFRLPHRVSGFHWHGETFELPAGAVHLAKSAGCRNQAFQIGSNVIGLQFHLEITPASLDLLIQNCRNELVESPYIQTEPAMRAVPASAYNVVNELMDEVLNYITRQPG